ncbi:hypothetical protein VXS84_06360 [Escherichia coli]|nr:hypothetical protein [Escherichia coli]
MKPQEIFLSTLGLPCPCGSHSAVFNGAGIYASGRRLAV